MRLRIEGHHPGLRVSGFTRMSNGAVLDLAFFDEATAHGSGHYPLVSLEKNNVFLTVVNLGGQDAQVVAQLFWDGGWTYSYGPVVVSAGASRRLDVRQLAAEAVPDMLGRTLDGRLEHGMLKWKVFEGKPVFVARTEVQPVGTLDTFGFSCFGCCYEFPVASIIPSEVSFFLNETPAFEAAITYDTCSGTMGPYSATPTSTTVPAPFNWDSYNVGASDTAKDDLSFTDRVQKTKISCETVFVDISAIGKASSCKHLLRRPDDPKRTWDVTKTCTSQVSPGQCSLCQACCDQILAWKECTKIGLLTANSEHQACLANCATDIC